MKTSGTLILSKQPRPAPEPNNLVPRAARPKRGGVRVQRVDGRRATARETCVKRRLEVEWYSHEHQCWYPCQGDRVPKGRKHRWVEVVERRTVVDTRLAASSIA